MQSIILFSQSEYRWTKNLLKIAKRNSGIKDYLITRNYGTYPPSRLNTYFNKYLDKDSHTSSTLIWTCDAASFMLKSNLAGKKYIMSKSHKKDLSYQYHIGKSFNQNLSE